MFVSGDVACTWPFLDSICSRHPISEYLLIVNNGELIVPRVRGVVGPQSAGPGTALARNARQFRGWLLDESVRAYRRLQSWR